MLKRRVVAVLVVRQGIVVQSIGFRRYLPVGSVEVSVEFLNRWGIDEIVLLDIDASAIGRAPGVEHLRRAAAQAFVPLTFGGGIRTLDHIRSLIYHGADKVSLNGVAIRDPGFISQAASVFGSQCIVVSIDVRRNVAGRYEVFADSGKAGTGRDPCEAARVAERCGAGEILLNSIDCDGMKSGYDLALVDRVSAAVGIPVIACGGVGCAEHLREGFLAGASAVAAGNFFHFSEHSPIVAKAWLAAKGIPVRIDSEATYAGCHFETITSRPGKRWGGRPVGSPYQKPA